MSLTVRAAVRSALFSDTTLDSKLARDPEDITQPAISYGTINDREPVYPSVTFRVPEETPDPRFAPIQAAGGGPSPIQELEIIVECWDNKRTETAPLEQIADAVEIPLDGRSLTLTNGAAIPLPSGRIFQISRSMRSGPFWDGTNKCWFVLLRFRARVQFF